MSTQEMTGTNKLAQRILDDARADAGKTAEEAAGNVAAIRAQSEKTLSERSAEYAAKREAAAAGVLDGCKTRASLEGRKSTLAKKRVVIDAVFNGAYRALLELPADARGEICKKMLLREAEGGETVVPAAADRAALSGFIAASGERGLTLSEQNADIDGGFLLVGASYEKDCSFSSLFDELRGAEETRVAALLFNIEGGQS